MGENERYSTTKKKFDLLAPAYSLMYQGVSDTISQQVQAPFQAQTTTAIFSITYVIHIYRKTFYSLIYQNGVRINQNTKQPSVV
jgi:hypothetical protein